MQRYLTTKPDEVNFDHK